MVVHNIQLFIKKFNLYLRAYGLETKLEGLKVAVLLRVIGDDVFELMESLNIIETDSDPITTSKMFNAITNYYEPKKNVIVEQFKFFKSRQEEGESFDKFLRDLRNLAKKM